SIILHNFFNSLESNKALTIVVPIAFFIIFVGAINLFKPAESEIRETSNNEVVDIENITETEEPQEEIINTDTSEDEKEAEESEQEYSLGETWTVDGQWALTVDAINETDDRNQFSDKSPAQVFVIDYTYENIGYEDQNGIMDGLYFSLEDEQIIDSEGFMGYSYPGDVTTYPQETPKGAKCKGQACIGVDSESSEIKINIMKYDGNGNEQKCTFVLGVQK
ncbi:MAG: hypothetical protein NC430_12195, partial [bacterium]|nr:hypothetical protein [bacterium]